jgi:hypothetical protein
MDIHSSTLKSELNQSDSYQRHKKQCFWQILIPVGLAALLTLVMAVLIAQTPASTDLSVSVSQMADASLIYLVLPVLFFAVLATLFLLGLIYLVARLLKILPAYTLLVQQYASLVAEQLTYYLNKVVAPLIAIKGIQAGVGAFFSSLFRFEKK